MGGGGHIADMVSRMRQNREILRSRHDRVRKIREMYLTSSSKQTPDSKASVKIETPVNIEIVKEAIRQKLQHKRQRSWLLIICIMIILLIVVICLYLYLPFDAFVSTFLN